MLRGVGVARVAGLILCGVASVVSIVAYLCMAFADCGLAIWVETSCEDDTLNAAIYRSAAVAAAADRPCKEALAIEGKEFMKP